MTDMSILTSNEKAHTDSNGMDFFTLVAGYAPATSENINNSEHKEAVTSLAYLLGDENIKFVTDDITVYDVTKPTAGALGVILTNPHGQASNMAIFPAIGEPFLLHVFDNDGLVIGEGEQMIATDSLENALEWQAVIDLDRYCLLVPFQTWQFASLVKAHAKHRQVMLFACQAVSQEHEQKFRGDNVKLIATVDVPSDLIDTYPLDEIINDPHNDQRLQTKVKVLNAIEWGEPEPLTDDTTPATPYPIDAFTGVLGDAVKAIAYHAQVPTAMAGQCVLGALSTIGQRYINAPMGHEHKPASLFLITEGESGSGKTQANKYSHHSIITWEKNAYQIFVERLQEWEADRNALKGAERTHYDATVPKPKNESMVVTDATIEAVLDRFIVDGLPNQSWTTSEAGQFLNGHSMKSDTAGNALSSLTSVWSGDPVSRLRSQRGKNATPYTNAYDARLTLDIMGQRVILEPALNDPLLNGQGFLPRCLIACPESLIGSRQWATPERMNQSPYDDPRLQAYWTRCDILLDPPPSEINRDITGKEVRFNMPFADAQARQTLAKFQDEIEGRQAKGRALEYLRAFASRMAENASRIASLMAFFDCQKAVTVDYLERAFLLVEYSIAERLRYLDAKPAEKSDSQKLIDWIIKQCKAKGVNRLSYADTQSKVNPKHLRAKANFELAIAVLVEKGYIQVTTQANSRYIEVNPSIIK